MEMPKTHKNGLHKYGVFNIKANLKIDTIENADFHGVKIEVFWSIKIVMPPMLSIIPCTAGDYCYTYVAGHCCTSQMRS